MRLSTLPRPLQAVALLLLFLGVPQIYLTLYRWLESVHGGYYATWVLTLPLVWAAMLTFDRLKPPPRDGAATLTLERAA